jgi:GDP/UDP-N,N'-diacetylbacillosamine 2-epimerase (hydrolysing)
MIKIIAYSAARSDTDRFFPFLNSLKKQKKVNLSIVASYIHYINTFGDTIQHLNKYFNVENRKFKINSLQDNPGQLGKNLAREIIYLSNLFKKKKPNILILMGDRYEILAAATASIPFNIPILHIYGGAVTLGAIDELIRHGVTKMSHLHLTAHDKYSNRLVKMGEEKWRIKTVGIPEITNLRTQKNISIKNLKKEIFLDLRLKTLLVTLHPTTVNFKNIDKEIDNLLNALKKIKSQMIFTYPNSDLGHQKIIKKIKVFCKKNPGCVFIKNASISLYANLLKKTYAMVGNSSSGIVEAASFKLPVVNIGIRQDGKVKPKNVINTNFETKKILKAINIASSKKFKDSLRNLKNPYEKKINLQKISNFILKSCKNSKILHKRFVD